MSPATTAIDLLGTADLINGGLGYAQYPRCTPLTAKPFANSPADMRPLFRREFVGSVCVRLVVQFPIYPVVQLRSPSQIPRFVVGWVPIQVASLAAHRWRHSVKCHTNKAMHSLCDFQVVVAERNRGIALGCFVPL